MIKKTILAARNAIFVLFVVVFLTSVMITVALFFGFEIKIIQIGNIQIHKIQAKLNSKIDLSADKLVVLPSNGAQNAGASGAGAVDKIRLAKRLFFISYFFDKIEVADLELGGEHYSVNFHGNNLEVRSKDLDVKLRVGWNEPSINIALGGARYKNYRINSSGNINLNLKDLTYDGQINLKSIYGKLGLNLKGSQKRAEAFIYDAKLRYKNFDYSSNSTILKYDFFAKRLDFFATARALDLRGDASGSITAGGVLEAHFRNVYASSIKKIIEVQPLSRITKDWIYKFPRSQDYFLKALDMRLDLGTLDFDTKYFFIDGLINNVETTFNEALPPALSPAVRLLIKNEAVHIKAPGSTYAGKMLDLAVDIDSISSDEPQVKVSAKTQEMLDKTFFDIARAYDVDLGIDQQSGTSRASVDVFINPARDDVSIDLSAQLQNALTQIEGFDVFFKSLAIEKTGQKVQASAVAALSANEDAAFKMDGLYKNKQITSSVYFQDFDFLDAYLLDLRKKGLDLIIDWRRGLSVRSSALDVNFALKDGAYELKMGLEKLIELSPFLKEASLKGGAAKASGKKGALASRLDLSYEKSFLSRGGKNVQDLSVRIDKKGGAARVALNNAINAKITSAQNEIYINNADLDITHFYKLLEKSKGGGGVGSGKKTKITGFKTNLSYESKTLRSDWFYIFNDKHLTTIDYKSGGGRIFAKKQGDGFVLSVKNLPASTVSGLFSSKVLDGGGSLSLMANGAFDTKEIYGIARIKNINLKEGAAAMNIVALLNTVPALIRFKSPGFTQEGYEIKEGVVDFYYARGVIFIKTLRLIGINTDIIGQGTVDINTNKIDLILSVNTIKDLSNLISKIPVFGYILLDKEKTIGTTLKIEGTLRKPIINTKVTQEILGYPANIIKRIVTMPQKIFSDE